MPQPAKRRDNVMPIGLIPAATCERALLANLLSHPSATIAAVNRHGLAAAHCETWVGDALAAAMAIHDRGEPVDLASLAAELVARRAPMPAGAPGWWSVLAGTELADATPERWAREIAKNALRRRMPALAEAAAKARPGAADALAETVDRLRRLEAGPTDVRVVTYEELLRLDLPPRDDLLAPILRSRDLAMVHGWRGSGKSLFAATVALGVASGRPVLHGWAAPTPAGVLLVDGELPARTIQARLAALSLGLDAIPSAPLRILAADLQETAMPSLATPRGQALVEDLLDGIELVICDNISSLFTADAPENDAESWEPVQRWLLKLRRSGLAVLLVHHSGKSGLQRGTSRREDVLDLVLGLRRPADYAPSEGARFEIHVEKARGLAGDALAPFEARLDAADGGGWYWTCKTITDRLDEEIRALKAAGLTVRAIAREVGVHFSTVSRRLRAIEEGRR